MKPYGKLTQGSIINSVKIDKYPDYQFYGVVITARCDIANCKVSKFYYLTAAPIDIWIKSEGMQIAVEQYYDKQLRTILKPWEDKLPDYEKLLNSPLDNIIKLLSTAKPIDGNDSDDFKQKKEQTVEKLSELSIYDSAVITKDASEKLFKNENIKSNIINALNSVLEEKHTHYCFIPFIGLDAVASDKSNFSKAEMINEGYIINLLDIGYLDYKTAEKIEKQELDFDKLTPEDLEYYNQFFCLNSKGDLIYPENIIISPYIEWIMQQFSQAFIRIGVEKPTHKDIKSYWSKKELFK
ncbi:MAG: hypothetical protein K2O28_02600 [Clostridia bacterium]|nr:hypothetical protein [Clostridia bacterium]